MRTKPPGEESEEGEGKKPMAVGEPGGLEEKKKFRRHGNTVTLKLSRQQNTFFFFVSLCFNKHSANSNLGVTLGVGLKDFLDDRGPSREKQRSLGVCQVL